MSAIVVERLSKSFGGHKRALEDVALRIEPGEMVALIGASGSGKSTLIRHVAGLVAGDRGGEQGRAVVRVHGDLVQRGGRFAPNLPEVRASVGVIFQQFNLVGRLSLLTNVLIGLLGRIPAWRGYLGRFSRAEKRLAMEALHRVGMDTYAAQRASTLSGGQRQRAAIARVLVQRARVILADEPIASLDPQSARRMMEILTRINREDGTTVLVSLHQVVYAMAYCPRTIALRDGRVVFDGPSTVLTPAFLAELYGAESEELLLPEVPHAQEERREPAPARRAAAAQQQRTEASFEPAAAAQARAAR